MRNQVFIREREGIKHSVDVVVKACHVKMEQLQESQAKLIANLEKASKLQQSLQLLANSNREKNAKLKEQGL